MTLTLAKLQQLKRQAGGSPAQIQPPEPKGTFAALSIERLRELLRVRSTPVERMTSHHDRALPGTEIAPGLFLREQHLDDEPVPEQFDGRFDRKEWLPASNLLFFDTETTGLAGGSGTRAFMIGAADWHAGALRIRQLTIANTAAEVAMLDAFREWLAPDTILVSYNGKCYDAPLLVTRYRLARRANPLAGLMHVDLLYPSRRRWRGVYENCRLATIERQVLRVVREDDLPGSQAPAAWLSYLRGSSAQNLRRVLSHNQQDVMSLSRLLRHLSDAFVRDSVLGQASEVVDHVSMAAAGDSNAISFQQVEPMPTWPIAEKITRAKNPAMMSAQPEVSFSLRDTDDRFVPSC